MSSGATWWIEVDGRVLPRPVAGRPGLELVNTRSGWGFRWDDRQEYLRSYAALLALARSQDLVTGADAERLARRAGRHPGTAEDELRRAVELRRDLHAVLTSSASHAAHTRATEAITAARSRQVLVAEGDAFGWRFRGRPTLADPLDALLVDIGDLLTTPERDHVRSCPGTDCGWLFVDRSGRRRWCRMAVCGNRAKQARHMRRTR